MLAQEPSLLQEQPRKPQNMHVKQLHVAPLGQSLLLPLQEELPPHE